MITGRTVYGINDPSIRGRLYLIVILFTDYTMGREFLLNSGANEHLHVTIGICYKGTVRFSPCSNGGKVTRGYDFGSFFGYGACKRTKFVEC